MPPLTRLLRRCPRAAGGAMLSLAAAAVPGAGDLAAASGPCTLPRHVVLTQAGPVRLGPLRLTAAAMSIPDPNNHTVRLLVRDAGCAVWWDETEDGLEARFDVRRIGGVPLLQFAVMREAGDGTGYVHELLRRRGRSLAPALPPITHTGKDGFFLGRLVGGGEGVVTWVADPTAGAEAAPHPYVVTTWRWRNGDFAPPTRTETTRAFLPSDTVVPRGDVVARAMNLPYRDQTGTARFMDAGRLFDRLDALEEVQP